MRIVAVCIAAFVVSSTAAAQDYTLGEGDRVQIRVYNEPDLSREIAIPTSCALDVELIGRVTACGRTAGEVAAEIQARYADGYLVSPEVVVEIVKYGSQKVEVLGPVKKPGLQILEGPTALTEVITAAGGPDRENVLEVDLIKPDGSSTTYQISRLAMMSEPVLVGPGDRVLLRTGRHVYVQGEVKEEGPVPFHEGMTATQALGLAGGPSEFASMRRAYILRANGEKIPVNVRRINEGAEADVLLAPDDQLIIRPSVF